MMVTLPFLMLVLDFWPLKRIDAMKGESGYKPVMRTLHNLHLLLREKIILIAIPIISAIVTVCAQYSGGAVQSVVHLNLGDRMMMQLFSYCTYIWKMVVANRLAYITLTRALLHFPRRSVHGSYRRCDHCGHCIHG
jgi:hypothetical protein